MSFKIDRFQIAFVDMIISTLKQWFHGFAYYLFLNDVLPLIPFWHLRKIYLKTVGIRIGKGTFISKDIYFMGPKNLRIGDGTHINHGCFIDARGGNHW